MSDDGLQLSWEIGEVRVTRFFEASFDLPCEVLMPACTAAEIQAMDWLAPPWRAPDGLVTLSIHALLVEAPGMTVVVDTCLGNDKIRETIGNGLATDFLDRLAAYGIAPEAVDAVLCTHLHTDHVGWNTRLVNGRWEPTFPRAQYLFARRELETWHSGRKGPDDDAMFEDSIKPVFDAGLARLVEDNHVLCDTLRLVPTPGHTPGHVSLAIESSGKRAFITGDMTHHPCQWTMPDWASFVDSDPVESSATRRSIGAALVENNALVIGTHYCAPTAGHLQRRNDAFRFIAMQGIDEHDLLT